MGETFSPSTGTRERFQIIVVIDESMAELDAADESRGRGPVIVDLRSPLPAIA